MTHGTCCHSTGGRQGDEPGEAEGLLRMVAPPVGWRGGSPEDDSASRQLRGPGVRNPHRRGRALRPSVSCPAEAAGRTCWAGVIALLPLYKYTERLLAASPPQKAAQRSQGKTSVNCKSTASLHQRTEPHGQPAPWELEAQAGCREPRRGQLPGAGSRGDTCTVTDDSPQAGRGELDTLGHSLSSASPPGAPVGPRVRS